MPIAGHCCSTRRWAAEDLKSKSRRKIRFTFGPYVTENPALNACPVGGVRSRVRSRRVGITIGSASGRMCMVRPAVWRAMRSAWCVALPSPNTPVPMRGFPDAGRFRGRSRAATDWNKVRCLRLPPKGQGESMSDNHKTARSAGRTCSKTRRAGRRRTRHDHERGRPTCRSSFDFPHIAAVLTRKISVPSSARDCCAKYEGPGVSFDLLIAGGGG